MARNIIVCFDGTNNEFGPENTNVVRLVQVLDRDPATQHIWYDPGVGTLPEPGALTGLRKKLSKWFGLAFGAGLLGKVGQAYAFLMDFWEPGDHLFLFGFSRGAYTARVLAGMLHSLGLMPHGNQNLVPYALRLFKSLHIRRGEAEANRASDYWRLSNEFRRTFARRVHEDDDQRRFPTYFLGLWDTVSSVGWVWDPARFPFTARNPSVRIARHAVSLDERRWFFRQNLLVPAKGQDVQERWFPGCHADVGGGYPRADGGLWRPSFEWLLGEADQAGMRVAQQRLQRVLAKEPVPEHAWLEPQHESLRGVWWLAEVFPKFQKARRSNWRLPRLGLGRPRHLAEGVMLHEATLRRIREKGDYQPPSLSCEFVSYVRSLPEVPAALAYTSKLSGHVP